MNLIAVMGIGLVAVLAFLARTVIRAEYAWWGPRLAEKIIHLASVIAARPGQREEWLGELGASQEQSIPGVMFSLQLVVAGVRMRSGHARQKRRPIRWHAYIVVYGPYVNLAVCAAYLVWGLDKLALHNFRSAAMLWGLVMVLFPVMFWTERRVQRGYNVRWVARCLKITETRDTLEAYLWTRGERTALTAWEEAMTDFNNGIPWLRAQRPLLLYRLGAKVGARTHDRRVRRAEHRAARHVEAG